MTQSEIRSGKWDLAVIGSGVVGQGVAWSAAKRGLKVLLFEKDSSPIGASVRNFGMVWPIGQTAGPLFQLALENRKLWSELGELAGFPVQKCGSLHLAHNQDEWDVLHEYFSRHEATGATNQLRLLNQEETLQCTECARPEGLIGSMWSGTECRVDPSQAIAKTLWFLDKQPNVSVQRNKVVTSASDRAVSTSCGSKINVDKVIICTGAEFQYLRPAEHRALGGRLCKLHMLATQPIRPDFQLGPHLASGLTLRHYDAFEGLPSLQRVKDRIAIENPELDELGIHVMMSQASDGSLVIGDSHQYDQDINERNDERIDELILQQCKRVFQFPVAKIVKRWSGVYMKHPNNWVQSDLGDGVYAINGFGGCGMTLSLAVTDQFIRDLYSGKPIENLRTDFHDRQKTLLC